MNHTRSALKNPAAIIVIVALIMVFGLLSVIKLPLQLTPDIEQPQISIFTGWPNAAPAELESVIIEPIENVVKNTQGVIRVDTSIYQGFGNIALTFDVGTDMQKAMLDVINNLNQVPPLPIDAIEPVVSASGGGNTATMMIKTLPDNPAQDLDNIKKSLKILSSQDSRVFQGWGKLTYRVIDKEK